MMNFDDRSSTVAWDHMASRSSLLMVLTALAIMIWLSSEPLHGEVIGWFPDLSFLMGQGVDLRHQNVIKSSPAVVSTDSVQTDSGDLQVDLAFAQTKFDFIKKFSLNSSISAKTLVWNANIGVNVVDNLDVSANALNFAYMCVRNLGTVRYKPIGVTDELKEFVADNRNKMSSLALRKAAEAQFGSYFISGVKKEIRVVVLYSFRFGSRAAHQSYAIHWNAKYGKGTTASEFSGEVNSALKQTETSISLTYKVYSTDPMAAWPIPMEGSITNFEQFQTMVRLIDDYSKSLPPERAKPTSYVIQNNDTIPEYLSLFNSASQTTEQADYDRFLEVYSRFKAWELTLLTWTLEPRHMSWLNQAGQTLVTEMRQDVTAYRSRLDSIAKSHFDTGTSLEVTDDFMNYAMQLSHIPLPTINIPFEYVYANQNNTREYYWLCYVHAGPKNLTVEKPFLNVSILDKGAEVPSWNRTVSPMQVYWDTNQFLTNLIRLRDHGTYGDDRAFAAEVLNSPILPVLLEQSVSNRIGFCWVHVVPGTFDTTDWLLALRDGIGDFADLWNLHDSRATPMGFSLEGSTAAAVSVTINNQPGSVVVGEGCDYVLGVTNGGPGAAYGVNVKVSVDPRFDVVSVGGSQGFGVSSNGQLSYLVGSLARGAKANIRLRVAPLQVGHHQLGEIENVTIGAGLTNLTPSTSSFLGPISASPPSLGVARNLGTATVSWTSETPRLVLDQAPVLHPGVTWSAVTNGIESLGSWKTLTLTNSVSSSFYRLRIN